MVHFEQRPTEEELFRQEIYKSKYPYIKMKIKFPTLAVILLVVGIVWLFNDLNLISIDIPWIPVILIIVAIGLIMNRYSK